jgi:hypothetical protein
MDSNPFSCCFTCCSALSSCPRPHLHLFAQQTWVVGLALSNPDLNYVTGLNSVHLPTPPFPDFEKQMSGPMYMSMLQSISANKFTIPFSSYPANVSRSSGGHLGKSFQDGVIHPYSDLSTWTCRLKCLRASQLRHRCTLA